MNFKLIFRSIGFLVLFEVFLMALCLIPGAIYGESLRGFLYAISITAVFAVLFIGASHGKTAYEKSLTRREGYLIVGIVWLIFSLFGSLPFIFTDTLPSFIDAFFESMSGFTTTGATTFPDVEVLSSQIILWRSIMQWIGGIGIIVLTVAIIPMIGMGGMQLYSAEANGPSKEKLHPHIKDTASRIYLIYIGCTALEIVLQIAGGMNAFDSVILTLSSISSGGFSNYNDGVANMSAYAQYITMLFMFISGVNFLVIYMGMCGKFRAVIHDEELRWYVILIFVFSVAVICSNCFGSGNWSVTEEKIRHVVFQVISFITTSGYTISDYSLLPASSIMLFFVLTFFGACAGSTSGAIKVVRITVLIKNSYLALKQILHPNAVLTLRFSKRPVSEKVISNVYAFIVMYIATFLIGVIALSVFGHDFYTAFSASALSISNVGIGFCPDGMLTEFSQFSAASKITMSILMLVGRLEIFTILLLFMPSFWKK